MPDIEEKVYAGLNALTRFKSNLARLECIASNEDLIGHDVTATQGTLSVTETIGDDGKCILRLPKIGIWQITEDLYSTVQSFTLPYYGEYSTMVGGDVFITVLYSEEFNYSTLTLTDGQGHSYSRLVDATGSVQFVVAQYGTWTVSGVVEGVTYTASVTAPTAGEYTINLIMAGGFDYEQWLSAGGVVGTYADLDEVLADEKALRQLFNKHDAVDYLVECCETELDENVEKIIKTDLCAKWINLRDYALDTLYANEFIADAMDNSGVVDMGETGLVPVMTSNTEPYGEAIGSDTSTSKYHCFDGTETGYYPPNAIGAYCGYKFTNPVCVKRLLAEYQSTNDIFKLQGSNDGTNYTDIGNTFANGASVDVDFDNDKYYLYYRVYQTTKATSQTGMGWYNLQFYGSIDYGTKYFLGEWTLKPQVPKMTANNAPYGEASASSTQSGAAWKLFDGDSVTGGWSAGGGTGSDSWAQYKFVSPVKCNRVRVVGWADGDYATTGQFKIIASNDGINFIDISEVFDVPKRDSAPNGVYADLNPSLPYLYYRIKTITPNDTYGLGYAGLFEVQFYAWGPKGNVPVMTSDSAPYGQAVCSSYHSSYSRFAHKAFDGDDTTTWETATASLGYVGYKFNNPVNIRKIHCYIGTPLRDSDLQNGVIEVIARNSSDDNWTIIKNNIALTKASGTQTVDISFENNAYYLEYAVRFTTANVVGGYCAICTLQFYGRELKVSVPNMTSNNAPWGEAIKSEETSAHQAYKAFIGNPSSTDYWLANSSSGYVGYDFKQKVAIKALSIAQLSAATRTLTIQIQGSDDGVVWNNVGNSFTVSPTNRNPYISINENTPYIQYRASCESTDGYCAISYLQFYGLDYSEHTERHWIYDHGVEVEEISLHTNSGTLPFEKRSDCIYIQDNSTSQWCSMYCPKININDYDLIRAEIGKEYSASTAQICVDATEEKADSTAKRVIVDADLPHNPYLDTQLVMQECYPTIMPANGTTQQGYITVVSWWLE